MGIGSSDGDDSKNDSWHIRLFFLKTVEELADLLAPLVKSVMKMKYGGSRILNVTDSRSSPGTP